MTDVKWSALTAVTDLQDTDILSLARSTANNKITGANLKAQIIADATNATQAELDAVATASVAKTLYDANTILKADSDNTPAALTMGASTILARLAAGNIVPATVAEIATLLAPSFPGYQFNRVQRTTDGTSTATTAATATTILTSGSVTYDGSTVILAIVTARDMINSSTVVSALDIWRDAADLGIVATAGTGVANGTGGGLYGAVQDTPPAGATVYTARLWVVSASTGTLRGGAGGAGASIPSMLKQVRV